LCGRLPHGCEGWTLKNSDESRIEYFEMKRLRQIPRVSWTARKTNEWIMEKDGVQKTFLASVKTKKLRYFGHIMTQLFRRKGYSRNRIRKEEKRKPKKTWLGNIQHTTYVSADRYGLRKNTESNG